MAAAKAVEFRWPIRWDYGPKVNALHETAITTWSTCPHGNCATARWTMNRCCPKSILPEGFR
jgi:hypothetical protein